MVRKKQAEGDNSKTGKNKDNENHLRKNDTTEVLTDRDTSLGNGDSVKANKEPATIETVTATSPEAELQMKLAELQDRYLRLSAEFDNYRKRTLREKIELTKTATESILVKLLPVLDDYERGLKAMETTVDCVALKEGIDLIYLKFKSFLEQNGVKEIESLSKDFDVDLHDAVTKVPAPDENLRGKVIDVIQKGYLLNDKVIRFSKVVVGE